MRDDEFVGWLEADLAAQAHGWAAADRDAEVAERIRTEWARTTWADRWRAAVRSGCSVELLVKGVGHLEGRVVDCGGDHVGLAGHSGTRLWVAGAAVLEVRGLPRAAVPPAGEVEGRWTLAAVLRRLAAAREPVQLVRSDGATLPGLAVAVGADHVDVVSADGSGSRPSVTWPLASLALVRTAGAPGGLS